MFGLWQAHKTKITALVLVVFPFILFTASAGAGVGESTSSPAGLGMSAMAWPQSVGASMMHSGTSLLASLFVSEEGLEDEKMEAEIARLREEKARLIGVLQENSRLRKLVGFKTKRPELELVAARVVARDTTPYFRVLKLELETEAELKPRMPVVVAEGVVGQIHRVYGGYADVLVLSDPRHRIDAIAQRTRSQAIVEGLGHEADYRARLSFLREKERVRPGDTLVTSGMDKIFPPELIIGTVAEVEEGESGLFQEAVIEPSVDFSRIEEVFVIVGEVK